MELCPYCNQEVEINYDDDYGYEENEIYEHYCESCPAYKDKLDKRLKQVVEKIPNKEVVVTYKWLREQGACQEAIDAFVEEFGKEAAYDDIIYKCSITNSWLKWLKERKHLLTKDGDVDYISVDKVDLYKKCYVGLDQNHLFFINEDSEHAKIGLTPIIGFEMIKHDFCVKNLLLQGYIIYEFDSFDNFVKSYDRLKEIQKEIE